MPRRVLLIGCGRIGSALGEQLAAAGSTVYAVRRTVSDLPAAVHGLSRDLAGPVNAPLPAADAMVITLNPGMGGGTDAGRQGAGYLGVLEHVARALPGPPGRTVLCPPRGYLRAAGGAHR